MNCYVLEGYAFLWNPPPKGSNSMNDIDYVRLLIQIFIVGLITGGLLFTVRTMSIKKE